MDKSKEYYKKKGNKIIKYAKMIEKRFKTHKSKEDKERDEALESLREAHREWKDKEEYFQYVTDPDLIDYAIYEIEASKIKYIYLLKKIKETNIE